jgi:hypothetical protein
MNIFNRNGALAFVMCLIGSHAMAASEGCADLGEFSADLFPVRVTATLSNKPFDGGETIILTADYVYSEAPLGEPLWAFVDLSAAFDFGGGAISETFLSSNDPVETSVTIPDGGIYGLGLTEFGAFFTDFIGLAVSCKANKKGSQYRPVRYTTAPDLHQTNIATCSGSKFVSGLKVVGGGEIKLYVDEVNKDECFPGDVTVLPSDVSSRNLAQVLAYLGSTNFDIFARR